MTTTRASWILSRDGGFTLLEALIVMAIAAFAVTMAASYVRQPARRIELPAIAQNMASQLRIARARALTSSQSFGLAFEPRALRYKTEVDGRVYQLPRDVRLTVTGERQRSAESVARIAFYGDGSSSGGRITMERDGQTLNVGVEWLTGHISIGRSR